MPITSSINTVIPTTTGLDVIDAKHSKSPKALIVGLGKTGLSCTKFLKNQGFKLVITDTRNNPPGLESLQAELSDVSLELGGFRTATFAAAEKIILSPGVPLTEPLVQQALQRGVPVLGDIELFAQALRNRPKSQQNQVVAVTGSNGKSTVVSLLGAMAQTAGWSVAVGGNLGEPALNLLRPESCLYILELSSFQLETTYTLASTAATVLNISPDHMDRYPTLDAYAQAKARIYSGSKFGIYNLDDLQVRAMTALSEHSCGFTLGKSPGNDYGLIEYSNQTWLCQGTTPLIAVATMQLQGRHNVANALAALALGDAVGLPRDAMLNTIATYTGLPHRAQLVTTRDGVRWYNDSKGTNLGATIAALEGLHPQQGDGLAILIAGGDCKGADFSELAAIAARTCRIVILIGRDAKIIEHALDGHVETINATDLAQAVQQAAEFAKPGDHVLLSPACASFDMFRNYEHRGDVFTNLVRSI